MRARGGDLPERAQRLVVRARDQLELEPFPLPPPGPGEVLVAIQYSAVSPGTELAFLQRRPTTAPEYPYYPGYSAAGTVVACGVGVRGLEPGSRVACNAPHASHALLAAAACRRLPDGLELREAAAFRLASIALQGVRRAQPTLGDHVAVLGLGPIGLLALQLARAGGALVRGIDLRPERRALALQLGAEAAHESAAEALAEASAGGLPRVVIEATGAPAVIPQALQLAVPRGVVILLGSPRGITAEVDFYHHVHKKGLTIIGAHESTRMRGDEPLAAAERRDEEAVLALLARSRLQLAPMLAEFEGDRAPELFRRLAAGDASLVLPLLRWA